jgi:oxygen-independent coproporphyrinogen-3 oxidase
MSEETGIGSYFVANYPPFGVWSPEGADAAETRLNAPATPNTPLGLYVHIPFCRKRCRFCYYKVYTEKNAREVRAYLDTVADEAALLAERAMVQGRPLDFVYFGGGTPSYLSVDQLTQLDDALRRHFPRADRAETTFECEPGTISAPKMAAIRDLGVTRVSLGIENFSDAILQENGRAHDAADIERAYGVLRDADFAQINIDLIAGMVGETPDNWRDCIERTVAMEPDSVTIYQMEVPFNTTLAAETRAGTAPPIPSWETKRRWTGEAFQALLTAGYHQSSGYTLVRDPSTRFQYRDQLWRGADLLGLGVSAFSHVGGVHHQNEKHVEQYTARVAAGELPLARGHALSDEERFIREFILQLKLGRVSFEPFRQKFGVDPLRRFQAPLAHLEEGGLLSTDDNSVRLTEEGLLRVDSLLPQFFLPTHGGPVAEVPRG